MMLTDEEIEKVAKPFIRGVGGYSHNEPAIPDNGAIEDFARAVIAANNAKALEWVKPWKINGFGDAYSANQVAPLIQRVKELEAMLHNLRNGALMDRVDWEDYPESMREAMRDLMNWKATS